MGRVALALLLPTGDDGDDGPKSGDVYRPLDASE